MADANPAKENRFFPVPGRVSDPRLRRISNPLLNLPPLTRSQKGFNKPASISPHIYKMGCSTRANLGHYQPKTLHVCSYRISRSARSLGTYCLRRDLCPSHRSCWQANAATESPRNIPPGGHGR